MDTASSRMNAESENNDPLLIDDENDGDININV